MMKQNIKIQLWGKFIKSSSFYLYTEKIHSCHNNPEKSYTEKNTKHTPSGYSLFTNFSFDSAKNKLDFYRGKDL